MGVWADRVEGRVVRSPSEAVSGPQACESEAPEAANTHTQILIYAHAHKCMYPYPYKHNPGVPHCRWILYQLSHKSTRIVYILNE